MLDHLMTYAQIKALSDSELFAALDREEAAIGSRSDASRNQLQRLATEIRYRASDGCLEAEAAERKFGC